MKLDALRHDLASTRRASTLLVALLATSASVNVLLAIAAMRLVDRQRVVLVPPAIHKSFWVEGDRVSAEYLEQMAYFLLQLTLNVTPQSVAYQSRLLLQYAAPASFGELRAALAASAERLQRDGASTVFSAQDLRVDEAGLRVGVRGRLTTFISDRRVAEVPKAYLIELAYTGGRIVLKSFREGPAHDPLAPPTAAAASEPTLDLPTLPPDPLDRPGAEPAGRSRP